MQIGFMREQQIKDVHKHRNFGDFDHKRYPMRSTFGNIRALAKCVIFEKNYLRVICEGYKT